MKKLTENKIAFGVLAGIVSAILMMSQSLGVFSTILILASFSTIIIAGLGAGAISSVIAVVVASACVFAISLSAQVFLDIFLLLAPAGLSGYLSNFARPAEEIGGPDNSLAWYPLSDILFYCALAIGICTWAALAANPARDELYAMTLAQSKSMMRQLVPNVVIDPDLDATMKKLIPLIWPMSQALTQMMVIFASWYFAIRLMAGFNPGLRPREDIPHALRMHRNAIVVFGLGVALIFIGGEIGAIGASLAGATAAGFIMAGYAMFHLAARGKSWRLPGLILTYILSGVLSIPVVLIFLIGGLANPRRAIAITPNGKPKTPDIEH